MLTLVSWARLTARGRVYRLEKTGGAILCPLDQLAMSYI